MKSSEFPLKRIALIAQEPPDICLGFPLRKLFDMAKKSSPLDSEALFERSESSPIGGTAGCFRQTKNVTGKNVCDLRLRTSEGIVTTDKFGEAEIYL
jgi:hypothetical protein